MERPRHQVEDNGGSKPRPIGDFINGIDPKRTFCAI